MTVEPRLIAAMLIFGGTAVVYVLSGVVTASSIATWYQTLDKPSFNPPDWVFTPVWTLLYAMMATAGWLAWRRSRNYRRRLVSIAFGIQLTLNAFWTILFFGLQLVGTALFEAILLLGAIIWAAYAFWPVDRRASLLFVPYACWVAFAVVLNAAIWVNN